MKAVMAVVINEFEVVGEPGPVARQEAAAPPQGAGAAPGKPESGDVQQVLRILELQALRVWAH